MTSSQELLRAQLPLAAQRAAAGIPRLHYDLAGLRNLDMGAVPLLYGRKTAASVAERIVRGIADPAIVDHALTNGERRHGVIETMLARFALTSDQQDKLAKRALAPSTANSFLGYKYLTNAAGLVASRKAEAPHRLDFLCSAVWMSDEAMIEELSEYRKFKALDAYKRNILIDRLAAVMYQRPTVVEWAMKTDDADMLVAATVVGLPNGAHEQFMNRISKLDRASKGPGLSKLLYAFVNLIEHPTTPIDVRSKAWEHIEASSSTQSAALNHSVLGAHVIPYVEDVRGTDDVAALDRMVHATKRRERDNSANWYQALILSGNQNLSVSQSNTVAVRLTDTWRQMRHHDNEIVAFTLRYPEAAQIISRYKEPTKVAETVPEVCEVMYTGRWTIESEDHTNVPARDIRDVDVKPEERWVGSFGGRPNAAAEEFIKVCGDDETAWSVLFSIIDGFPGTVGELADTVAATVA